MPKLLNEILPIENPYYYSIHFACKNGNGNPLDVFLYFNGKFNWQSWQESRRFTKKENMYSGKRLFTLIQTEKKGVWLFVGIYSVTGIIQIPEGPEDPDYPDYHFCKTDLTKEGLEYVGRLKVSSHYKGGDAIVDMLEYYDALGVHEIAPESEWRGDMIRTKP